MKDQDKIKAIAELSGRKEHYSGDGFYVREGEPTYHRLPNYLTSRDAIIPVIEKQPIHIKQAIGEMCSIYYAFEVSAKMYCEFLLRATGKWIE